MKLQNILAFCLLFIFSISNMFAVSIKEIDAARYLAGINIIQNHDNIDDFNLAGFITRKEVMKTVGKLSGKVIEDKCDGTFLDVNIQDWGCKYIEFALREGLIEPNTHFRPEDLITKTEAVKLILKVKGIEKTQVTTQWQEDYMMTAFEKGIIEEKYTDYNATATRGWIFMIATSVVKQEREMKMKNGEVDIYSDEAL